MTRYVTKSEHVKVFIGVSGVACVYYGGAHLFEECYANPFSANYVGNNNNNNNNRYNKPYNNT